jgi:hypothetical protein
VEFVTNAGRFADGRAGACPVRIAGHVNSDLPSQVLARKEGVLIVFCRGCPDLINIKNTTLTNTRVQGVVSQDSARAPAGT